MDDVELRKLVQGFKGSALFEIVSVAAFTGARRNEIPALRWSDLDMQKKEITIERAAEETKARGLRLKGPKNERGKRTITIDDDLFALLLPVRERQAHRQGRHKRRGDHWQSVEGNFRQLKPLWVQIGSKAQNVAKAF